MTLGAILYLLISTLILAAIWTGLIKSLSVPEKLTRKQTRHLEDAVFFMSILSALWLGTLLALAAKYFTQP